MPHPATLNGKTIDWSVGHWGFGSRDKHFQADGFTDGFFSWPHGEERPAAPGPSARLLASSTCLSPWCLLQGHRSPA